jgi:DNA repair protein RecN (Recombination protein N)
MICSLHIKNIGIIDDLSINLNNGFNVLTGETGAGKTLIIDSLQILSGGRFSKEMIRHGETFSFVELSLFLPNNTFCDEENIIISREVHLNGRNLCKINGRMVTVSELKEFMKNVIDIHGQNDNQSILDINSHLELLDSYASNEINSLIDDYSIEYNKYVEIKLELSKNYGDDKEKMRKLDLLRYQANEISDAKLKENEEDDLEARRQIILNSEKISKNLSEADCQLSNNVIDGLSTAIHSLEKIENFDNSYSETLERLKSSYYDLQEISRDVSGFASDTYFDENEQSEIEERLDLIFSLKRKYGNTISEILEYEKNVKQEIEDIENLDEYIISLKAKLKTVQEKMLVLGKKIHEIRIKMAEELSNKINLELIDLEMQNAKFSISVNFNEDTFYKTGLDKVEFLISTNIGEDAKPLIKIASGGEMSRIMLAIKTVLANIDKIPVMIFDEIDTGISGIAANKVGEKMKSISKTHQVICVTHLAPIAAKGDYNYFISKSTENNKTKTSVKELNEDEVIREIARISSGSISNVALEHAKELRSA